MHVVGGVGKGGGSKKRTTTCKRAPLNHEEDWEGSQNCLENDIERVGIFRQVDGERNRRVNGTRR